MAAALGLALLGAGAAAAEVADEQALLEQVAPFDEEASAVEAAVADAEAIGARLRRLHAAKGGPTWWPRVAVSLSWTGGGPARLARAAAAPDALDVGGHAGLVWSIVATWGSP